MNEPTIRRKFGYVDLEDNSNKWWMVEHWADGKTVTTFGRVGYTAPPSEKNMTEHEVDRLISSKMNKGYKEISLLKVSTTPQLISFSGQVGTYVNALLSEAGEAIKGFLSVSIDDLSEDQINKGRAILANFNTMLVKSKTVTAKYMKNSIYSVTTQMLIDKIEEYYTAIPTQLPHNIDPEELAREFSLHLQDEEDKLDQLQAALKKKQPVIQGGQSSYNPLGDTSLEFLSSSSQQWQFIQKYLKQSSNKRLIDVVLVKIPRERESFETTGIMVGGKTSLWHGTHNKNGVHILRSGLIIPKYAANGSRFGRGIYFADKAARSINYTGYINQKFNMLFLCDVALGKPKKLTGTDYSLNYAPAGYNSVWGAEAHSGMDEFIV